MASKTACETLDEWLKENSSPYIKANPEIKVNPCELEPSQYIQTISSGSQPHTQGLGISESIPKEVCDYYSRNKVMDYLSEEQFRGLSLEQIREKYSKELFNNPKKVRKHDINGPSRGIDYSWGKYSESYTLPRHAIKNIREEQRDRDMAEAYRIYSEAKPKQPEIDLYPLWWQKEKQKEKELQEKIIGLRRDIRKICGQ